ncbi:MAG: hypothetical protein KAJ31_05120 [Deltaproteobacteria bacterium]|nr:hypothetical protein [Deltaproteobacteria bacterium]
MKRRRWDSKTKKETELPLMGNIISNPRLHPLFSDAYEWLCLRRCKHPPSSDVWDFRRNWKEIKEFVIEDFTKGTYKLSVQKKLTLSCGDTIAIWSYRDALVIKVLTSIIQETLKPVSVRPVTTTSIRHPQFPLR